jgi:hypothetical protein
MNGISSHHATIAYSAQMKMLALSRRLWTGIGLTAKNCFNDVPAFPGMARGREQKYRGERWMRLVTVTREVMSDAMATRVAGSAGL